MTYESVSDFWERTGYLHAICDTCNSKIERGKGHLATTEEIVESKWYREENAPRAIKEVEKILGVNLNEKELDDIRSLMFFMVRRSRTQWLLCEECFKGVKM